MNKKILDHMVTLCENTDITDFEHSSFIKKFKACLVGLKKLE